MAKKKGTSNVPMIMGIIGGVLSLPAVLCTGVCGAALKELDKHATTVEQLQNSQDTQKMIGTFMWIGVIASLLGLIGGILGKKMPVPAGLIMLVATIMSGSMLATGNIFVVIPAILFLIGCAFCFAQKKEEIK